MDFLSPAKLLVVFVVIMIVIGPNKLPQVARQLGVALQTLRDLHAKVERDVREAIPELPSTAQIARMARSPAALLNTLADMPLDRLDDPVPDPGAPDALPGPDGSTGADGWPVDPGAATWPAAGNGTVAGNGTGAGNGTMAGGADTWRATPGPRPPASSEGPDPGSRASEPWLGDPSMN